MATERNEPEDDKVLLPKLSRGQGTFLYMNALNPNHPAHIGVATHDDKEQKTVGRVIIFDGKGKIGPIKGLPSYKREEVSDWVLEISSEEEEI